MTGTYNPGETKIRPGAYFTITTDGGIQLADSPQGTVCAIFRSSRGPLGVPTILESLSDVQAIFGASGNIGVAEQAFKGGAARVVAHRFGTGGSAATKTLVDTAGSPANTGTLAATSVGVLGNSLGVILRDSLTDTTKREVLVYDGSTLIQTIPFDKGGGDEAASLATAVAASGSRLISFTKTATGNGTLAAIGAVSALTGGADPTYSGSTFSDALTAVETSDWNILVVDVEDTTSFATLQTFITRIRSEGKLRYAVLGEKASSITFATRKTDSKAFNDPAISYVGEGVTIAGVNVEGMMAAALYAGMVAREPLNSSLTHKVVRGATGLVDGLTNAELEQAIQSGMVVFSKNAKGQIQVEAGITTFITQDNNRDLGWGNLRRTRQRDNFVTRVMATWEPMIGNVDNDENGRAALAAAAGDIAKEMIAARMLVTAVVEEDPSNQSSGTTARFRARVKDLPGVEYIYIPFAFTF